METRNTKAVVDTVNLDDPELHRFKNFYLMNPIKANSTNKTQIWDGDESRLI